jgi:carboxypeptidase Taq
MKDLKTFYEEYKNKTSAYSYAMGSIYFDQATVAPKDGVPYSNEVVSFLSGEAFAYSTDPENIKRIEELYKETSDPLEKKEIELRLRDLHQISKLPKDVYVDFQKAVADSQYVWEEAKEKDDYALFKPHLMGLIEKRKHMLTYFDFEGSAYDYLLDQFQVGMNKEKYDAFFKEVKDGLIPLIKEIGEKGKKIDNSLLFENFDVEDQIKFTEVLKESLNVNPRKCYLTESVHPFTSFFSGNDARITTRYHADNVMSAVLATIHEYGHAQYGLQVDPKFEKTTFSSEIGFAMHESQSRLMENHIGRNRAFWEANYPKFQAIFPAQLKDVSLDSFMEMMDVSTPSLIRIEADELTYPLHIVIRYELEKEIFDGAIDCDNLDVLWADKYEAYLGVRPTTTADGILQDMHWGAAYFGYFPTYALGSAFAAQFYNQLEKDVDVDSTLRNNEFEKISEWLKVNIHQYGASKTFDELLLDVTGETFNPKYYVEYLTNKYRKIYGL